MTTQRTEHNFSSNDIIHLIVNHGLFTEELDVFRENTMEQILVELADNLRLDSLSSQIKFINVRTSDMSRDRTITVEELGLIDGDTLMIDDASPDATIVSYFWLVNNTLYRISKECSKGRKNFHELSLATVYKGNIIKNLIMDCQSYTKYRPNETTGGIFVSWRRKEELPTGA